MIPLVIVVLAVLFRACSGAGNQPEPTASPAGEAPAVGAQSPAAESPAAPSPAREEKLVQKFEGTGKQGTRPFTIPDRWELRWNMKGNGNNVIQLNTAEGRSVDLVENAIGPTEGSKFYPTGGDYFLEITGSGAWTIEVWQLA